MPSSRTEVEEAWDYLEERFGIDRQETEYSLKEKAGDIWITSSKLETNLKTETEGIRCLRRTGRGLKPTTYALQLLDNSLKKNVVEVDEGELLQLLRREQMIDRELEEEGYVAIQFEGRIIGCGMYKEGVVSSRVPKGRGKELACIIE